MSIHADTVGSYIRPESVIQARRKVLSETLSAAELTKIEDVEIKSLIDQQVACGLIAINDGEYRRAGYSFDFWLGFQGIEEREGADTGAFGNGNPAAFAEGLKETFDSTPAEDKALMTKFKGIYVAGKIKYNPNHPELKGFEYLNSIAPKGTVPQIIIPSPIFIVEAPEKQKQIIPGIYATYDEYVADISTAFKQTLQRFYELGVRRVHIDEPSWLIFPYMRKTTAAEQIAELKRLIELSVKVLAPALKGLPADLKIGYHACRGNGKCKYHVPYTYHDCIPGWAALQPDFLLLEYDDPSLHGDLSFLQELAKVCPKVVVHLGVVSTKTKKVETVEFIEKKIEEATKFFPKERLGICNQCGFQTGTTCINECDVAGQWAKVKLLVEAAKKIWGSA